MAGRSNSSLWAIVITVIALTTFEKEARSQGTPPPAVTVKPVLINRWLTPVHSLGGSWRSTKLKSSRAFPGSSNNAILPKGNL